MTIYTLYIKTHKLTGLKYLGQTTKNPDTYKGSGIDWKLHLKEWGNNVSTQILYTGNDREEMKQLGRYYSELWNVKYSLEWANRIPETGGGDSPSEKTRKLLSNKLSGKKKPPRTQEHRQKLGDSIRDRSNPKTSEGLKRYFSINGFNEITAQKQSKSLKKWYKENPDKASMKAIATWDGKYKQQYEEYKVAIELAVSGRGVKTIKEITGMYLKTESVKKLRDGTHRIFTLFPVFKQLL